jgi:hypothetical protein
MHSVNWRQNKADQYLDHGIGELLDIAYLIIWLVKSNMWWPKVESILDNKSQGITTFRSGTPLIADKYLDQGIVE